MKGIVERMKIGFFSALAKKKKRTAKSAAWLVCFFSARWPAQETSTGRLGLEGRRHWFTALLGAGYQCKLHRAEMTKTIPMRWMLMAA